MNVAIVTTWFPAGAGYVSKAYEEVLSRKHHVFIYARGGLYAKGDPEWDHINVTWSPRRTVGGMSKWHFQRWILKNKIDIVFFNEQQYFPAVLWAKDVGVVCGAYIDYYTAKTIPLFAAYDFLVCNTKRHYSVFSWHEGCQYIPWGVSCSLWAHSGFTRPDRPLTFIASAGWSPAGTIDRRGTLLALYAFLKVRGDCCFKVYSQVARDKMAAEWLELAEKDKRIEFITGTFSPFPFHEGDVYVYPSRLDGIGLTLPEALASGLPAITTNAAPMNEFVQDGVNGRLVEVASYLAREDAYYWAESICDKDSLVVQMQSYVDDPNSVKKHAEVARQRAIRDLDWLKNAESLNVAITKYGTSKPVSKEVRTAIRNQFPGPFDLVKKSIKMLFVSMHDSLVDFFNRDR